jgi:hypothetical protein
LAAEDRITACKNVLSGFLTSIRFMASRLTQGDQFPYDQQADKKVGIIVTVTIDTEFGIRYVPVLPTGLEA